VNGLHSVRNRELNSYKSSILSLIERVIGDYHDPNDFVVVFNSTLNEDDGKDTFEVCLKILIDCFFILINER
jgi:hypothetical protein